MKRSNEAGNGKRPFNSNADKMVNLVKVTIYDRNLWDTIFVFNVHALKLPAHLSVKIASTSCALFQGQNLRTSTRPRVHKVPKPTQKTRTDFPGHKNDSIGITINCSFLQVF